MCSVACVILNYNDAHTTIKLINSIKEFDSISKIIVVDNNSTDNSYEVLKSFNSLKIDVISSLENKGYGYGNNYGIHYLKEKYCIDYVIIANPDVLFDEFFVKSCLNTIVKDKSIAVVTGKMIDINNEETKGATWKIPNLYDHLRGASSLINRIDRIKGKETKRIISEEEVEVVSGSLFMIDIEKFLHINLFDENIFLYEEENVLAIKLKKMKYKTIILNDIYFKHLHSVSINKTFNSMLSKRKLLIESKIYLINNYYEISNIKKSIIKNLLKLTIIEAIVNELLKKAIKKENKL